MQKLLPTLLLPLLWATPLWADETGDAMSPVSTYPELATLSAIVASTLVLVEVFKKLFANFTYLEKVPTWVLAMVFAIFLTLLSKYLLAQHQDAPLGPMLWQAALLAASASGFWTWLRTSPAIKSNVLK